MAKKKSKSKTSKHPAAAMAPPLAPFSNDHVEDVIAAAQSKAPPPVFLKVCRLCEMKDGPFLKIFDAEKVTARKIEELMPFGIAENDDLPHKICFRCSAKVEELHEFIQKCIKTQENLRSAMGKEGPLTMKYRTRVRWEQQLNKTIVSNDDICDVLIKRAMEGISLNATLEEIVEEKPATRKSKVEPPAVLPKPSSSESESDDEGDDGDISLKQVKLSIAKTDAEPSVSRSSRSTKSSDLNDGLEPFTKDKKAKTYARKSQSRIPVVEDKPPETQKSRTSPSEAVENKVELVVKKPLEVPPPPPPPPPAPPVRAPAPLFNIMDHVSTIKVNGVGILYQCKLCVRNFLKKDMVMNHGCAKNSAPPKESNSANAALPEPPKAPTVKYMKMDKDPKKPLTSLVDKTVERLNPPTAPPTPAPIVPPKPEPEVKLRPKVGPASRVRPKPDPPKEIPILPKPAPQVPSTPAPANPLVSFPIAPSLNSRYKLIPGPNNTFQLVEETVPEDKLVPVQEKLVPVQEKLVPVQEKLLVEKLQPAQKGTKRKADPSINKSNISKLRHKEVADKSSSPEVIDLDENNESQKPEPYPVGLFQPVPHHSSVYPPSHPPVPFTTPAMKKQSYTIVQTGNPSKLLISTKPQPVTEEPPKKKSKKKPEVKEQEPYKVTLEDATPPKDPGFFTFVSLDPLLQPSYVLPTDNIIQESQITTSTPGAKLAVDKDKEKYPCNMCGETFSREKKLLAHIQSHYNQMDEEDEKRVGKPGPKRKTRKAKDGI